MAALFSGCGARPTTDTDTLYVSILPLRGIVSGIVGDDIRVEVLVPAGASPETFEPTPKQFIGLNNARKVFSVGMLDFETALLNRLEMPEKVVNLSKGIEPIAGSCSHSEHGRQHLHGIDPHVWTSPRALQTLARNAYEAIHALWPDSVKYTANYEKLASELRELDAEVGARLAASGVKDFIIYHPALTYYARDYALEQIAVEADGKEPSARRLADLIRLARENGTRKILYQSQFPASVVEVIARDINAQAVVIDPLREDVIPNIREITNLIATQ